VAQGRAQVAVGRSYQERKALEVARSPGRAHPRLEARGSNRSRNAFMILFLFRT
jgi:hypothetical protein